MHMKKMKLSTFLLLKFMLTFFLLTQNIDSLFASDQPKVMCKDTEREALLTLKQDLIDPYGNLSSSWGHGTHNNNECCKWWGVTCSNETGHVTDLVLSDLRGEISSSLLELHHLIFFTLRGNDFGGVHIPYFIGSLKQLEHLVLSNNNFSGDVPYQLGNLTKLKELYLSDNNLTSSDLTWLWNLSLLDKLTLYRSKFEGSISWLSNLTSLSELDLSWNSFSGSVPDLEAFHSLSILDLRNNELTDLPSSISNLSSLDTLDLSFNQFGGPLQWICNLTSLSVLDLSSNSFIGEIPDLKSFSSLTVLYLTYNKLTGQVPESIGQLSNLEVLDVSLNSLEGTISDIHLSGLHKLNDLNICLNSLSLNLAPDWVAPFNLSYIFLARCNIGPRFPAWLETQRDFIVLDLSDNDISAEVPGWFWHLSDQIANLNLSNNNLSGIIPDLSSKFVYGGLLDVSSNNFYGPLPLLPPSPFSIQLSENMFSGTIRSICSVNYDQLIVLDLSSNRLSGELPDCWDKMAELEVISLANNNFSGHLPRSFGSLIKLQILNFRNNSVSENLPSTLKNCSNLVLIDGGRNELTGRIPAWLGAIQGMKFLSLRHNNIDGVIPPEIFHLSSIQVLDLSVNNISGTIPQCFQNFTSLVNISTETISTEIDSEQFHEFIGGYVNDAIVEWKRQESQYKHPLTLLMLIDLSSNKLVGSIPPQVSLLSGLVSLNLSRNDLTGNMNPYIGQMKMLESLDLSRNRLSGVIPDGLAELHFLAVLDLSSNNLSGRIPKSTQLQSFDASAYGGNNKLCGAPLPTCPGDDEPRPSGTNRANQGDTDEGLNSNQSLFMDLAVSVVLGYVVGVWVVIGPLMFSRSCRNAYFGYLSKIGEWLYVRVASWKRRLTRYMNSRK